MEYNNGYYFVVDFDKDQSIIVYFRGHSGFIVKVNGDSIDTVYPNGEEESIDSTTEEVLDQYGSSELIYLGEKTPVLGINNVIQEGTELPIVKIGQNVQATKDSVTVQGIVIALNDNQFMLKMDSDFGIIDPVTIEEYRDMISPFSIVFKGIYSPNNFYAVFNKKDVVEESITEDYSQTTTMFSAVPETSANLNPIQSPMTERKEKIASDFTLGKELSNAEVEQIYDEVPEIEDPYYKGKKFLGSPESSFNPFNGKNTAEDAVIRITLPSGNTYIVYSSPFDGDKWYEENILDESIEKLDLSATEVPLKVFKKAFARYYSYIYPNLTDSEIQEYLNTQVKEFSLKRKMDLFADWVVSQGLGDVQESVNRKSISETDENSNPIIDAQRVMASLEKASTEQEVENALQYLPGLSSKKQKAIQWLLTDPKARKVLIDVDSKFNAGLVSTLESLSEEVKRLNEEQEFTSHFSIGENVTFRPMFRHQEERGIADEERWGKVVNVTFTEAKVFYDILDDYLGEIFDKVDSTKVVVENNTKLTEKKMTNKNTIKEGQGDQYAVETRKAIVKYPNNDLVQFFVDYVKKNFKDTIVYSIVENGDVYTLDLSFTVEGPQAQMQYNRENAKVKAYEIKRKIEGEMLKKFDIPSFSIQGLKLHKTKDQLICDFSISLIYSNHNNKQQYESVKKLTSMLEDVTGKKVVLENLENSVPTKIKNANDLLPGKEYYIYGGLGRYEVVYKGIKDHKYYFVREKGVQGPNAVDPKERYMTTKEVLDSIYIPALEESNLKEYASTSTNIDQMGHFYLDLIDDGKTSKEALDLTAQNFNMNVDDLKTEFANNHITESLVKEEPKEVTTEVLGLSDEKDHNKYAEEITQLSHSLADKAGVDINTVDNVLSADDNPESEEHVKFVKFLLANNAEELREVSTFFKLTPEEVEQSIKYYKTGFSL